MGRRLSQTERTFYVELGAWLARKRRALNLSQRVFGLEFAVGADTVARWERGKAPIPAYAPHRIKAMAAERGMR